MLRVLGKLLCDLDPKVKVKDQIIIDVATSNFVAD